MHIEKVLDCIVTAARDENLEVKIYIGELSKNSEF